MDQYRCSSWAGRLSHWDLGGLSLFIHGSAIPLSFGVLCIHPADRETQCRESTPVSSLPCLRCDTHHFWVCCITEDTSQGWEIGNVAPDWTTLHYGRRNTNIVPLCASLSLWPPNIWFILFSNTEYTYSLCEDDNKSPILLDIQNLWVMLISLH